jgi:hypothetical protein
VTGRHKIETLIILQPVTLDTGSSDQDGRLVLANGRVVAILVRLDASRHEGMEGWFLEVGLGHLRDLRPAPFDSLEAATRWLRQHLRGATVSTEGKTS